VKKWAEIWRKERVEERDYSDEEVLNEDMG
jgi:hypothetical protein